MTKIIIRKKNQDTEEPCNMVVKPSLLKSKSRAKTLKPLPEVISINNYTLLLDNEFDYKVLDLKKMCSKIQKEYEYKKMKTTGTKVEMKQNIYNFYFCCI